MEREKLVHSCSLVDVLPGDEPPKNSTLWCPAAVPPESGDLHGRGAVGNVTVVIPLYFRPRLEFVRGTVCKLVGMKVIDRIILVAMNSDWINPMVYSGGGDRVVVVRAEGEGLGERFRPRSEIRSEAVLSMDDDFRPDEAQVSASQFTCD